MHIDISNLDKIHENVYSILQTLRCVWVKNRFAKVFDAVRSSWNENKISNSIDRNSRQYFTTHKKKLLSRANGGPRTDTDSASSTRHSKRQTDAHRQGDEDEYDNNEYDHNDDVQDDNDNPF